MPRPKSPDAANPGRSPRVSRRRFLEIAGAGTVATTLGPQAVPFGESDAHARGGWDLEADVVVVGSGAAALTAAVLAAEGGADVLVLEKARTVGGTTVLSGGGHWIPNNSFLRATGIEDPRDDALRYMARFSYPHLYDPGDPLLGLAENDYALIAAYYDNAAAAIDDLAAIDALHSTMGLMPDGQPWPDYFDHAPQNKAPRGRLLFPVTAQGSAGFGGDLIRQLRAAIDTRGVPVLLEHRATRLVVNGKGEVVGLEATTDEGRRTVAVRARRAVVFGTGGFTHNRELRLQFQRGPAWGGCAAPTAEGDFVAIGGAIGARLWNMKSAWRLQVVLDQVLETSRVATGVWQPPGDSMVVVDKYGHRVVNEKRSYNDRTEVHFNYDPSREEWSNLVLFMIYDQRSAEVFAGNFPIPPARASAPYILSGATFEELAGAIAARLDAFAPRTGGFHLDERFAGNLRETVDRFNRFAESGVDEDFRRGAYAYDRDWHQYQFSIARRNTAWPPSDKPNLTMHPLSSGGPYHAVLLAAGMLDTNGGPAVNASAQVLDAAGEPIPGLYGAGNCIASPSGRAYWGGGTTIGSALTFGYIAGRSAAREPVHAADAACAAGRRLPGRRG